VKNSSERILTTHTGSLPRSKALTALLVKQEQRKRFDPNALTAEIERNLDYVVKHRQESGVDIGNDGETPRVGFSTYMTEPLPASLVGSDFAMGAFLSAPMDCGEIIEKKPRAVEERQQRSVVIGGERVNPGLDIGEILSEKDGHI
jgi:methionine synthase II (cobalamin-independent)